MKTKYREILKLKEMLEMANIPFHFFLKVMEDFIFVIQRKDISVYVLLLNMALAMGMRKTY